MAHNHSPPFHKLRLQVREDAGRACDQGLCQLFWSFRVSFIPDSNLSPLEQYTAALQAIGIECLHAPYIESAQSLLETRGGEFDVVLLTRGRVAIKYINTVRKYCPRAKIVFNTVDLHYIREERRLAIEKSEEAASAARELKVMELEVVSKSDATIVVSEYEREILARELPERLVFVIPIIREIEKRSSVPFNDRHGIAFVGGFNHLPNRDAVQWFCHAIWPTIERRLPSVDFRIFGSNMTSEIRQLEAGGIKPIGFVRELDSILEGTRLTVAPLRYGAGQKGKIVQSLAAGIPCVTTSVGAEGMGLTAGKDIVIADTPGDFADAVARTYCDPELWQQLSIAGFETVRRKFGFGVCKARYKELLHALSIATPGNA